MRNRGFHLVTNICLLAGLIACSPKHPMEPARGVQVSGGGSYPHSTADQVNAALDQAIDLATRIPELNVIVQYWVEKGSKSKDTRIQNPAHIFPEMVGNGGADPATSPALFNSPMLRALKQNRIIRLNDGDCLNSSTQPHKDASVSAFNLNADVCFSIANLRRIPPSALLREILSLVLHEASHMGGANESEAIAWQADFSDYFGARFGDLTTDTVTEPTLKALSEMRILLSHAESEAKNNGNPAGIYGRVGRIVEELQGLPYFKDSLALELKIRPPHPELIDNYSNSVLTLIQMITDAIDIQQRFPITTMSIATLYSIAPTASIGSLLNEIGNDLDQITENFMAFTSTSTSAHSQSVLPKSAVRAE